MGSYLSDLALHLSLETIWNQQSIYSISGINIDQKGETSDFAGTLDNACSLA
jgi:hypothetical protein